jgi:hypothetical protein
MKASKQLFPEKPGGIFARCPAQNQIRFLALREQMSTASYIGYRMAFLVDNERHIRTFTNSVCVAWLYKNRDARNYRFTGLFQVQGPMRHPKDMNH